MVLEEQILPYWQWLFSFRDADGAFRAPMALVFAVIVLALLLIGLLFGFLRVLFTPGTNPAIAARKAFVGAGEGFADLFRISPGRLYAMSWLSFQESIRNWAVIAFAIFVIAMLFAGWFLDVESDHPARLYLSTVLTFSNFLLVILALYLSAFSLPNDIEDRTIYTIVTKPVLPVEIILGRVLGFTALGSILLAIMMLASYVFVVRGLDHTHEVEMDKLTPIPPAFGQTESPGFRGTTTNDAFHRHEVTIKKDGAGETDYVREHKHEITVVGSGSDARYVLSSPTGMLLARVPVYGRLQFLDRSGKPSREGINVGNEWTYRGYVEGGTLGAGVWTFDGITEDRFPDGLPIEMTLRVFRTYKGDIEKGILGTITLRNPDPNNPIEVTLQNFRAKEFATDQKFIPRTLEQILPNGARRKVDLFRDLVHEGRLQIWIRCAERAQYYGMAQPDLYLRAAEEPFWFNFFKGHVNIWLRLVLVISFGVMFSTFLNAPVALLANVAAVVLGYFGEFIRGVALGKVPGGGPFESFVRIYEQKNVTLPYDDTLGDRIIKAIDFLLKGVMLAVSYLLPAYREMGTADYVAYGFNIPGDLLAQHVTVTLAFALVVSCIGYFTLRGRELAA